MSPYEFCIKFLKSENYESILIKRLIQNFAIIHFDKEFNLYLNNKITIKTSLSKDREEIPYKHYQEGADDMPAHIKTSLSNTCLSLSFQDGKMMLGTWQAVYLWEHRFDQKERIINVHIIGEKK